MEDFKLKTFRLFFEGTTFVGMVALNVVPWWILAVFLIMCDYVTKTQYLKRKLQPLEPRGWLRSVDKAWMFLIGLLSASLIQHAFIPTVDLTRYVAAYICIREVESIFKNIGLTAVFYSIGSKILSKEMLTKINKNQENDK